VESCHLEFEHGDYPMTNVISFKCVSDREPSTIEFELAADLIQNENEFKIFKTYDGYRYKIAIKLPNEYVHSTYRWRA
jgi:hypothetical protein